MSRVATRLGRVARRGIHTTPAARGGPGLVPGHIDPPFYRIPAPRRELHEENELVWNDGVAPETCLDFDAPHVDSHTGLLWWLGGFAFFYLNYKLMQVTGLFQNKKTAPRELPESTRVAEGMYEEENIEKGPVMVQRSS